MASYKFRYFYFDTGPLFGVFELNLIRNSKLVDHQKMSHNDKVERVMFCYSVLDEDVLISLEVCYLAETT